MIDTTTGDLRMKSNLTSGTYLVEVSASDSDVTKSKTIVNVRVPECPLECPTIIRAGVPEEAVRGTDVAKISVSC